MSARSLLFFPGDDARKGKGALAGESDAIVFDLEDGVAAARKDAARALLHAWLDAPTRATKLVRVNDPSSEAGRADLETVAALLPATVVVPKARLSTVEAAAGIDRPIVALVEDAAGLLESRELASHPVVVALALGSADLRASLGLYDDGTDRDLLFARSTLVVASSAAGIRAPFDGPCLDVRDPDTLRRETLAARNLGLRGKICIHPDQVNVVHRCFAPSANEVDWARGVLTAWEESRSRGTAVGTANGELVDRPVVLRAQGVLEAHKRSEADV